jgi:hypothetical protein
MLLAIAMGTCLMNGYFVFNERPSLVLAEDGEGAIKTPSLLKGKK